MTVRSDEIKNYGAKEGQAYLAGSPRSVVLNGLSGYNEYLFTLDDSLERITVQYENRYGIVLAGDLYRRKDLNESEKHPALIIGPPHGAVKEQAPGVYANQLAQQGFVVLAFDPSFNGESGGNRRRISSPEIFAEDFSAGVDFLGSLLYVDRERIGAIGICGSGGFLLAQATVDQRIKAIATSAMYDISGLSYSGFDGEGTAEQRKEQLAAVADARWADVDGTSTQQLTPGFPADRIIPEDLDPISAEFFEYYVTDRGHHPRSVGAFTVNSYFAHPYAGELHHLEDVSPRPVLIITGDQAHSRHFSERAYEKLAEPKKLLVQPNARHIDLYDDVSKIPFEHVTQFFQTNL
ncbi:MAG: alpha/beta hydrolase [Corynebacterium sp.]|nr:alpha/beta hydrolase [Corynebacterium sp.]